MTRCAVIGLGNAGFLYDYPLSNNTYSHAKAYFELKNTELIAASEIDQKKIKIFQSVYNVPVYNSYLDMMEHEKIDIDTMVSDALILLRLAGKYYHIDDHGVK